MIYSPTSKKCLVCEEEFFPRERMTHERWRTNKYCSLDCCNSTKKGVTFSEEHRKAISKRMTGRTVTQETRDKIALSNTGKKRTPEQLMRLSVAHIGVSMPFKGMKMLHRSGEKHWNWKGGKSKHYKSGYYSFEYKEWRKAVFERDEYTCQECKATGIYLTAHHIKSFAEYPELRFVLENGRTLCEDCHSETDNYKGRNLLKNKQMAVC